MLMGKDLDSKSCREKNVVDFSVVSKGDSTEMEIEGSMEVFENKGMLEWLYNVNDNGEF